MIPLNSTKLFKKEPKKIIRIIGLFYIGIGGWCLLGMALQRSMMKDFSESSEFVTIKHTLTLLHHAWIIYMPLLALIGALMVLFSYMFDKIQEQRLAIQKGILILCIIWAVAYTYANIPYIKAFQAMLPEPFLAYVMAVFAFGVVMAFMVIPNYKVLKRLNTEALQ